MTTPAVPEPAESPAGAGLEQRVNSIEGKLDQVLGFLSGTPDAPAAPAEPERPEVNIAEEIRRQLEARDAKAAKPKEAPAAKADGTAEKPPVAPVRRVSRIMGWAE